MEQPTIVKITKVINEAPEIKTFEFEWTENVKPGQFVMLWVPGVEEMPLTLAYQTAKRSAVTVCNVGPGSKALHQLQAGDQIGIRGPYGTWFDTMSKHNVAMLAGGYGAATCYFLATQMIKQDRNITITFILGARTKQLLLYVKRLEAIPQVELKLATDDGSAGHEGYNTDLLPDLIQEKQLDCVYSCGPELMMHKVAQICQEAGVACQLSLERHMKCGIGVCGSCCVDDGGFCMCQEGPVVTGEMALSFKDFGKYHRDASGAKQLIKGAQASA